ncbi:27271_t:CDS:2, partial [Gigaspora margarita]
MDISNKSNSSSQSDDNEEVAAISNRNNIGWDDAVVTIDSHRIYHSYSGNLVVNITDIRYTLPRQFFEQFLPVEYFMTVVIPSTNKCAHASEREIIKYLTLTDKPKDSDPFYNIQQFHATFNENLRPGTYLCINESMCQWMGQKDKGSFQRKILRKPHPIGCKFKALTDAQANLLLQLDPVETTDGKTIIADSWFGSTNLCITLFEHGLYSILQIKKCCYWPKNIPSNITSALESAYESSVSRVRKLNRVDLTVCSVRDHKNIVVLSSCSTICSGQEIKWYIKNHSEVKFKRLVIFDEFNEYQSAVDILNNIHDNALSYHDHVSFRKGLVKSIFDCYTKTTTGVQSKKRCKDDSNRTEHSLISLKRDPTTRRLKEK